MITKTVYCSDMKMNISLCVSLDAIEMLHPSSKSWALVLAHEISAIYKECWKEPDSFKDILQFTHLFGRWAISLYLTGVNMGENLEYRR